MSIFILKIIAIISMFCDHFGKIFISDTSFLTLIGRLAFPIFAFGISQGFIYSKNNNAYLIRLLIFALISQIPYTLFLLVCDYNLKLNIFFTLCLGLLSIIIYDKISTIKTDYLSKEKTKYKNCKENPLYKFNIFLALNICFFIAFIASTINVDYGFYGVSIILLFYVFRNKIKYLILSFIICNLLLYMPSILLTQGYFYILCLVFTTLSLIPILFYNRKKGANLKYIFYLFYPLHLIVLVLIKYLYL